ncbi:MAG: nucleoside monophosphate kinase [Candidatus Pacearchaeota archaeon]
MKLIFIGAQASGKGTQAKIISEKLGIKHISTGDLLRSATGGLKKEIESYTTKGNLVPDELIFKLLKEKIKDLDGFILDGFPRNLKQVEMLNGVSKIDKIIEIKISDSEAVRRISGRRSCPSCGRIYNIYASPVPIEKNLCDDCDVELVQRADDTEAAAKKRLEIYHNETEPILKKYPSVKINGEQEIREVSREIEKAVRDSI